MMKHFLLALLLCLASNVYSVGVDGEVTRLTFDGDALDTVGGHDFTNTGGVSFPSTFPPPFGTDYAGTFATGKYFLAKPSFDTAVNGDATWTDTFYIYQLSNATTNTVLSYYQNATNYVRFDLRSSQRVRLISQDTGGTGLTDSATGVYNLNEWTFCAVSYDGTTFRAYVSPADNIDNVPEIEQVTAFADIPVTSTLFIGRHGNPAGPTSMNTSHISMFRHFDRVITEFPVPLSEGDYIDVTNFIEVPEYIPVTEYIVVTP